MKINIPENANNLIHILQSHGYSAYVVGGCVRDSILNKEPHDWDICTSATPDEMLEIFKDKKIIETGLQHGTVTVVVDGEPYEITTYRIDGDYSDNRRPDSVTFTNDLVKDLSRRDFTINAMAYNDENGLIDPFNGLEDIEDKVIRCVGNPKDRFNEDALRILRAIRFACQLDFSIHPSIGWEIGYTNIADNLKNISVERINSELCKMVVCDSFYKRLTMHLHVFGLIIPILDKYNKQANKYGYNLYSAYYSIVIKGLKSCESNDLIIRLTILFSTFFDYNVDGLMKHLRFDNETRTKVVELVSFLYYSIEPNKYDIKKYLKSIGIVQFKRLLTIKKIFVKNNIITRAHKNLNELYQIEDLLSEIIANKECYSLKDLAIDGNDVKKAMMIKEGKDIGFWLNKMLDKVMKGELSNNKEDLIYYMTGIADGWIQYK